MRAFRHAALAAVAGILITGGPASAQEGEPPAAVVDNFTPPSPGPAHRPAEYPRIPQMLGQEGITLFKVCVSATGAVTELGMVRSSGHDLLDRAARNYLEDDVRYQVARRDGMPVDYCRNEVVVWELQDESGAPPPATNTITLRDYPPESVENNEQGIVTVNICVAADGHIDEVRLVESSGYTNLDIGTIIAVTAKFRYSPAMQGDTPVRACFDQQIQWGLQ
jgi:TonB family protein